jgi:predicted AAA+ superfamily ATPase
MFIIYFLPAWSSNLGKRLVKSPKIYFADSGLAAHLCDAGMDRFIRDTTLAGRLFESFMAGEILKQTGWTEHPVRLHHYRSQAGDEADLLLEDRSGNIAAVEIKLSQTVTPRDVKSMAGLRDSQGDSFVRGVAIYTGHEILPLGDRLVALPADSVF